MCGDIASAWDDRQPRDPVVALIDSRVATAYEVTVDELLSFRNGTRAMQARQMAMYLTRRVLGLSHPETARLYGRHAHKASMTASEVVSWASGIGGNKWVRDTVERIEREAMAMQPRPGAGRKAA